MDDEVIGFLKEKLSAEEEILRGMEEKIEPQREKVRRLRASLAAQQTGTFGSKSISDHEIIELLRVRAREEKPMLAAEIAGEMGLDTRGLSRRLPRMVKDGLIFGAPATGYWA